MKTPVRVAVTGAAGQIGYSILFRIAAGEMLGRDQPVILQMLELPIDKAQAALEGRDDGARGLRVPAARRDDRHRRSEGRVQGRRRRRSWSARSRAGPGMERKDLLLENAKIFIEQGKALDAVAARNVQGARGRQPGQHQRLHRDEVGAVAAAQELHRDAAPRPQPRPVAARRQERTAGRLDREAGRLGQPLADDVRRLSLRHDQQQAAQGADQRRRVEPRHVPARRSASAARPSSRRAACRRQPRRPTPPSITCATGCSAATASG